MKKIIKSFFAVVLAICVMTSLFVFNVSAASVSIGGTGEYEVGKSFKVTINFSADAILYAVEASVNYNSSVLRLDSVSGADYNVVNGVIKIVDDGFSVTSPTTTSSYTLGFTAIAAGNSNITVSVLGGGDGTSSASNSASVNVVTPKPSSNANLSSIKLSAGSLSPAFNANTTSYSATVKYDVDSITITGAVADGGATYTGGGTFGLEVGDNSRVLTVTAADGTKKSYTVNIKRMSEQETLDAEQAARDANPLLVIIEGVDYTIVNDLTGVSIPSGFTQGTSVRKENEITVLNDDSGKYQLCWLVDANGENGAFYSRDENDNFTKLVYINANNKMYIVEDIGEYGIMPTTFNLSKCAIDGNYVEAIAYADESFKDFYIINCYTMGTTAYYRFDTVDGTVQRAVDFDAALITANTEVSVEEPEGKFAWFTTMNTVGKTVFIIMMVVALMLITLAVILIVKISSAHKYDDFDGEINSNANEFILDDFADTVDQSETQPLGFSMAEEKTSDENIQDTIEDESQEDDKTENDVNDEDIEVIED